MSNFTTDNGLTISGNTGTTNINLGGSLSKYTTYIYGDGNKNNLNNYQSLWFGASGQTTLPNSGISTQVLYKPLSDIKFSLSGTNDPSSAFQFNEFSYGGSGLPMTNDSIFSYSGTSINHIQKFNSTEFGYCSFIQLPDQMQFSIGSGKTNGSYQQQAFIQLGADYFGLGGTNGVVTYGSGEVYMSAGITKNASIDLGDNGILFTTNGFGNSAQIEFKETGVTLYFPNNLHPVIGGFAITDNFNTTKAKASGRASFAMGNFADARGLYSFVGGHGTNSNKTLLATGNTSFNFSTNDSLQTAGHGALADNSFILGGQNHNIPKTALRSGILGGNGIKASLGITDTVYLPKLRIGRGVNTSIPVLITGQTAILGFTNTTGEVGQIRVVNGLTYTNGMLKLGGSLTGSTVITDLRTGATAVGIEYGANYSSNYTKRSLVDKGFVTGLTTNLVTTSTFNSYTGSSVVTANNGLTKSGNNIHLGGNLTGDTTISALTHTFKVGSFDASVLNDTFNRSTEVRVNPDNIYLKWNKDLQGPSYIDVNNNGFVSIGDGGAFAAYITETNSTGGTTSGSINISNGNFSISASDATKGIENDYVIQTYLSPTTGGLSIGGYNNFAGGLKSFASGSGTICNGDYAFAHGVGPTNGSRIVLASGRAAINISEVTTGQTAGHGANAANSAIIGGINANIPNTSPRSVVLGGKNIKVPLNTTDTVFIPNLRVSGGTFLGGLTFSNKPTAWLHLPGSSGAAGRAPLKFNSTNTLMFTPEDGAVEYYNNDKLYFTIHTGAARKEFTLNDTPLTAGHVPIVTTNGRLTENTGLTFTNNVGLNYGADYSASFTKRSLVDKGFVTGITSTFKNPIKGSFIATGISTTVFTVMIGSTMSNTSYVVQPVPTSAIATIGHYIANKTTTSFDVIYTLPITGQITFDWVIIP